MPLISDNSQNNKLKKFNINIKTKYIVHDKILERNTNNSYNDDIKSGIRCKKEYYIGDRLLKIENQFDSRIEYTFIANEDKEFVCVNCGLHTNLSEFVDGCPYCGTYYNLDYTEKDLGSKYHYDRVLRTNTYRVITGIVDLVFSLLAMYYFIKFTSRTFNVYDISKIFIYGFILSVVLYYFFYLIDGYIVLKPIKLYKDGQKQKQVEFWNRTKIDKKKFFNNLNYEIGRKYFNDIDVIDYDILDYDEFTDSYINNVMYVKVKAYVRVVKFVNGKLKSMYITDTYNMKRMNENVFEMKNGTNFVKCNNCGASVDVVKEKCDYCGTKISPLQEWILDN